MKTVRYGKDLSKYKFTCLQPIKPVGTNKHNTTLWLCICDCGEEKIVTRAHLVQQDIKSCGCYMRRKSRETCIKRNTSHGMSKSRVYNIWANMKARCNNKGRKDNPYYYDRGITYDPAWDSFEVFYKDMGDPPHKHELDRIDSDKGYYKDNCRWASRSQQMRNIRRTKRYNVYGEQLSIRDMSELYNIKYTTIRSRINGLKWDVYKAINYQPPRKGLRHD